MDRFLTAMISLSHTALPFRRGGAMIVLLAAVLAPASAGAASLTFGQIIAENDRRYLELAVNSYQGADILEAVKRGIEAKVSITVQLVKESMLDYVYSRMAHSTTIRRSLRYDYWNRAYVISEGGRKTQFHNENEMFSQLFRVARYEIPDRSLEPGTAYLVRARAQLRSVELYFPMNYIFKYIVGYWDFDTGWVYGPGIQGAR